MKSVNPNYIIICDNPAKYKLGRGSNHLVVSAEDYIAGKLPEFLQEKRHLRVINLCSDYNYLHTGYYCSLLAQARKHRCIPSVSDIVHAKWKRLHRDSIATVESDPKLQKIIEQAAKTLNNHKQIMFFFGRSQIEILEKLGRILFDAFRLPIMKVVFHEKKGQWKIKKIEPGKLADLHDHLAFFNESLEKYIGSYWVKKGQSPERYWLAILHDENDSFPTSNKMALKKFIEIGRKKSFYVELIDNKKFDSLLEYDALFIRTTTNVNHYTYNFAQKAAKEDIPCIDDKESILLCCNKIFLYELLKNNNIAVPPTFFISRNQKNNIPSDKFDFPLVLKIPDGSFSTGVFKVKNSEEYHERLQQLFKQSELILVQKFLPSEFDWRIGILDNKPIFACKYFMAKKHWQIYNHSARFHKSGEAEAVDVNKVPPLVLKIALKAANLIGDGLYGVDIKEIDGKPYIIEINDNPNIDAGIEDAIEGNKIYEAIFNYFEKKINE